VSDHFITFIPSDHLFVPDQAKLDAIVPYLKSVLFSDSESEEWHDVNVTIRDTPQAVVGFENFSEVRCPFCNADVWDAWNKAVERATESAFRHHAWQTPCCGIVTTVNQTQGCWPTAFGRCSIEVSNPDELLATEMLDQVEAILGCGVRVVYGHL
jgi:hypothetical protein